MLINEPIVMMMCRRIFYCLVSSTLSILSGLAQSNTVASGGGAQNASGSIEYSIGQIDYLASQSVGGSVQQGNQHPFESSISTDVEVTSWLSQAAVFPNPFISNLSVRIQGIQTIRLQFIIHDILGHTWLTGDLNQELTTLPISGLDDGMYVLSIRHGKQVLRTFQILKLE